MRLVGEWGGGGKEGQKNRNAGSVRMTERKRGGAMAGRAIER